MAVSRQIGKHYVQIDGDILFMKYVGDLSLPEMEELIALLEATFGREPYYAILDYSEMASVDAAARKRISAWTTDRGFRGAAIYGASMTMRAVTALVQSAIRLLSKKYIPVVFVKDDAAARVAVAEMKQRSQAQKAAS
jgi:hypothetical protein